MRRLLLILVCAFVLCPGPATEPASAAPVVSIRARTDVQLRTVRRREDGLISITGTILERASAQGIGGLDVTVTLEGVRHDTITQQDGTFAVLGSPSPGAVDVEIAFAGDERFDPVTFAERDVDPSRAPVDMTIEDRKSVV